MASAATRAGIPNRFGIRILTLFLGCAIVPVLLFSAIAYRSTETQLIEDAEDMLREDAKAAGMAFVEKLSLAAERLRGLASSAEALDGELSSETNRVFLEVERVDISSLGLTGKEERHLEDGGTLLRHGVGRSGRRDLLLYRLGALDEVLSAALKPGFVFTPERLKSEQRYWISYAEDGTLFDTAEADGDPLPGELLHAPAREIVDFGSGSDRLLATSWPIFLEIPYLSSDLSIGMSIRRASALRALDAYRLALFSTLAVTLLGCIGLARHQIQKRIRPIDELLDLTALVSAGDYTARWTSPTEDEFGVIGSSINEMADSIQRNFETVENLRMAGAALLNQSHREGIGRVLAETAESVCASNLVCVHVLDSSQNVSSGHVLLSRETSVAVPEHVLSELRRASESVFETGEHLVLHRPNTGHRLDWESLSVSAGEALQTILAVPIESRGGTIEGVIQVIHRDALDVDEDTIDFFNRLDLVAGLGSAAIGQLALQEQMRGLFEGVVQLTVDAIDKKSAYTGGHCRRVPELTEMIADAVAEDEAGPLKDIRFDEDERYELQIAALLHDCGKVATPVHVMDKATKLEAIHDRIELVRLRAEVLRRELEARESAAAEGRIPAPGTTGRPSRAIHQLRQDVDFVERFNTGAEFMSEEARAEIDAILARHSWLDESGARHGLITPDEALNLKIGRGTLNEGEREIINEHVVLTMQLLERLPFPDSMKNVPAIAGAHHERVDGTGYPLGLEGHQISVQGRILGLADVFEALTAKDRPYKPGKTMTETISILEKMVDEGHLDPQLYETFLRQKVHLRYAAKFMAPEQIDGPYQQEFEELSSPWA